MRTSYWLLAACFAGGACFSSSRAVLQEPLGAGTPVRYAVAPDSLAEATRRAIVVRHLHVTMDTTIDSARVIVGSSGYSLLSSGEISRVAISPRDSFTLARVLSRPVKALDFSHRNAGPQLVQSIDGELHGFGLGPFEGDKVQVTTADSRRITGRVISPPDALGRLRLNADHATVELNGSQITRMRLSRGSYGHFLEGSLMGSVVGLLVGAAASSGSDQSAQARGMGVGGLVGMVVGGVAGSAWRTEIWSEVNTGNAGGGLVTVR